MKIYQQESPYSSPWSFNHKIRMLLWEFTWTVFCSWTPKPLNPWRIWWLKVFRAKIYGRPFVHQRARIQIPWNITLHHQSAIGDRANLYSLGKIEVHEHATIAQEAYICTGTHAFNLSTLNLLTAPIFIGKNVFIGARAFIMPGVYIEAHAIVGACAVVTKNVEPFTIVGGNPSKKIGCRKSEKS